MILSISGNLCSTRVNDNRSAFHRKLLQFGACHRMCICWIRTDDHNQISVLYIIHGIGCRTCTKSPLHTKCCWRMTYTRATINIVSSDDRAYKFLHQVVFFIRTTGRGNTGDVIRSEIILYSSKLIGYILVSLIPCCRHQFTILSDQRCAKAIRVIVEGESKPSFQTCMSLVDFGIIRCLDRFDFFVDNCNLEIATYTTISTYSPDLLISYYGFRFEYI